MGRTVLAVSACMYETVGDCWIGLAVERCVRMVKLPYWHFADVWGTGY